MGRTRKEVGKEKKNRSDIQEADFKTFIYKVLKQVHPETGITDVAMQSMNNLIKMLLKRIMAKVNCLVIASKKRTILSKEILSGVRLALHGELSKHAVSEGTKAITKYTSSSGGSKAERKKVSSSARAGLQFPVARVKNLAKQLAVVDRCSDAAAVFLAAVLEYMTAEILELAGNSTRDNKRSRIKVRDIKLAIKLDKELDKLFCRTVIGGGVRPAGVFVQRKSK